MLQEASVVGLFKLILTFIVIYYVIKILSRIFAPFLFKYAAKKAEERFGQGHREETPHNKEGEVSIDKVPTSKSSNKSVGEYVDFEEVE